MLKIGRKPRNGKLAAPISISGIAGIAARFSGALSGLPVNAFAIQTLYYSFVAGYGSYLVLYFKSIGFTATQIGVITSVSTFVVLLTQPIWGFASDRAKDGRTVLSALFLTCAILIFAYYLTVDYIYVLIIASLFAVFYNPIAPVMDSLTLETIENDRKGFDYGHVRVGGTIGYSVMVLVAGRLFRDSFRHMFLVGAIFALAAFFFVRRTSSVKIRTKRGPLSFRALLKNKTVFCFMFVNLIHAFGMMGFYSFYPLHFTANVGNNQWFGVLLFSTAMSELPFWFISGKIVRRFGHVRMMFISTFIVGIRWFVLYFLTNIPLVIFVNLLHGFCFVTVNYCIITYINDKVPKELRATGQTMNNLTAMVISRVLGGIAFGRLGDILGIDRLFLFLAALSVAGAFLFVFWVRAIRE